MYKLEFTLKQHTPIIHFQHDQEGATLRASEVKPKLDRFIIEKLKQGGNEVPKDWLVGKGEHPALAYKLKVLPTNSFKVIIANRMSGGRPSQSAVLRSKGYECVEYSPYFAQEKEFGKLFMNNRFKDDKGKWINVFSAVPDFDEKVNELKAMGLFTNDYIKLQFTFFDKNLHDVVESSLATLFASNNFGTRQSKGFGCFLPAYITDNEIIEELKSNPNIKGIFQIANNTNYNEKFKIIAQEYSVIKRGDSQGPYKKSKIWEYFCSGNRINWEKKAIKIHIKNKDHILFNQLKYDTKKPVHLGGHHIDVCTNENNDFYIRALLGLAELYEFATTNNERIKVKIGDTLNYNTNDQIKKNGIDRFACPIRYLFSDTSIFISTTEIPEELIYYIDENNEKQRRKFRFTIDDMSNNNYFELPVPENFNLEDFIEKKMNYGVNNK